MAVQVSPQNVVGRDRLIEQIWRKLETKSLRFTAERRIGKTTVMKKMLAEPRPGTTVLFLDLEKADSPERFTEVLLTEMRPLLSARQKAGGWFDKFLAEIEGVEVGGVIKIPNRNRIGWKGMLEKAFDRVCSQHADTMVVLLFDELPYMLQKIAAREKQAGRPDHAALEMLDTLRAMRHQHANLRMIFAGSVGLHHVLNNLRGTEFASQPVNDMPPVEIQALDLPDAVTLAKRLLQIENVNVVEADSGALPNELALLTDRVPFYLERVVARLAELDGPVYVNDARQIVREHLTDDNDVWEMEHFRGRLNIYYHGTSNDANGKPIPCASVASAILDVLATAPEPQTIDQVWAAMKAKLALDNRDQIIQLLKSLAQDHYLTSDSEKRYVFRFPLIRQWWVFAQGICQ
jgi:hypothetical protein